MEPVCKREREREWILKWNTYLGCPEQVLLFVVALHENKSETYSRVSDKNTVSQSTTRLYLLSTSWMTSEVKKMQVVLLETMSAQ